MNTERPEREDLENAVVKNITQYSLSEQTLRDVLSLVGHSCCVGVELTEVKNYIIFSEFYPSPDSPSPYPASRVASIFPR